ncbi:MAG: aspartate aminotransferase family protein [Candidatus Acidiferrales bacterium]
MKETSALFPRSFRKSYPVAVRGEGCYIYTADGKRILDAAGGAAVVSIGHGVAEIAHAMAGQAGQIAFAHTSQFHTKVAEELAGKLRALAPRNFRDGGRVWFTSGGSEATETALKLVRQYWLERGQPQRVRVVSRWQSYHGATLGAMTVSGNYRRRAPYTPWLAGWGHIDPCYCYRCPLGKTYPECKVACADELESFVLQAGLENVAAFIVEPVSGATLGGVAPPDGYLQRIAEICTRYEILLVADEILTGLGRTGRNFAVEHWGVEPDLILIGKGAASGYAPLGAVLAAPRVWEPLAKGSGGLEHGFTYQASPVAAAAGLAVLKYAEEGRLFERVAAAGGELMRALEPLRESAVVGDVRGLGLLAGVEFVRDKASGEPFAPEKKIADRVKQAAWEAGVATYPIQGCVDGERGDHVMLAPPFIISSGEVAEIARALQSAVARIAEEEKV